MFCQIYLSILLSVFFLSVEIIDAAQFNLVSKPECNLEELNRIDLATARLLTPGPNGRKIPENFNQLKPFCEDTKKLTNQLDAFIKKCYNKHIAQMAKISMYQAKKSVNVFCGSGTKRAKSKLQQFLTKANPCINKHLRKNSTCMEIFTAEIHSALALDDKMKIPYMCCLSAKSLQCIEDEVDRHKCGRQNRDLIMDFLRSNTDDYFNMGCQDYTESSDKCEQLSPLKPSLPIGLKRIQKPSKTTRVYATPVFLMIDLISSIGNDTKTR